MRVRGISNEHNWPRSRPVSDAVCDPGNAAEIDNGYPYNNIAQGKGLWDNGIVATVHGY